MDRRRFRAVALAGAALLALGAPVRAEDPPATPEGLLAALHRAYALGPTCERVAIELRTPGPGGQARVSRSTITVRVEPLQAAAPPPPKAGETPAPAPAPAAARSVALDLGALRVWAGQGRVVAVHERDPATYYSAPLDPLVTPQALAAALPPVVLPQLELACTPADHAPLASLRPYAEGIRWTGVEADPKATGRRTLHGVCAGGTVEIETQASRLRAVTIDLPERHVTLTMRCTPLGLCEPARWEIGTEKRSAVESLGDLRPRTGALRVGSRLPDMPMTARDGGPWAMADLLQPPAQQALEGQRPAEHVVLVFLRTGPAGQFGGPGTRLDVKRLAAALQELREATFAARSPGAKAADPAGPAAQMARFGLAPVLVLSGPAPDEILTRIAEAQRVWGPDVLWTTNARSTIDLLAPGADAAVLIADADWVLRAAIPVDAGATAEGIADQVAAALFELAPAEGPAR